MPYPTATIDLSALQHNYNIVKQYAPSAKVAAMLKANAYGHGAVQVAKALDAADAFAVARVEEAMELRDNDITKRIVTMAGFLDAEELQICVEYNIDVVIHSHWQLDLIDALSSASLNIWLKVDTGMGRLGFTPEEFEDVYARVKACKQINEMIILTHFPDADDISKPTTDRQVKAFHDLVNHLPEAKSLAKSAGIIAFPDSHCDWVRPGLMLYGVSSVNHKTTADLNLKPVMTLRSKVISTRTLPEGHNVGYGGTYVCPEAMPIAVIACGYGDGYPRSAPLGTQVLVNGHRAVLIGRVSMDSIVVDIRGCGEVKAGDEVVLWGNDLPAEEIAKAAGTIAYELFCRLTKRVKFVYKGLGIRA